MWESFHIYNCNYEKFINNSKILIEQYKLSKGQFFFTIYSDFKGQHFRLRVKGVENIDDFSNKLNAIFSENSVYMRIYDQEILKYKEYLNMYENFSGIVSDFIVFNHLEEKEVIGLVIKLLECFSLYNSNFIQKAMKYWSNTYKYFSPNSSLTVSFESVHFDEILIDKLIHEVKPIINQLTSATPEVQKHIAFNFIHMTLNRLNYNPRDEVYVYYLLLQKLDKGVIA